MKKQARVRARCVAISGERDGQTISMRVQTVEGENLSAETVSALLAIGKAAYERLGDMVKDPPVSMLPVRKKRKAGL